MLLTGRELSKHYGPRLLFEGVTLGVDDNARVGLIGPNGSGKSTLLKILAGIEAADEGQVVSRRGLRVGYVPQEEDFETGQTVLAVVAANAPAADLHERELAAEIVLSRAGLEDASAEAATLSGGGKKRLSIARQLAAEPDVLLMDEPTNHLDLDGVLWLEGLVKSGRFAAVVVTHDRRFLESVATRIFELDRRYPEGFFSNDGGYRAFVEKRELFLEAQRNRETALASNVRREEAWLRRGAKARTTKAKGRIERAGEMSAELSDLRRRNAERDPAAVDFTASGRRTRKLVELKGVARTVAGRTLFRDLDVVLSPGSKLGLIGPNGGGKTTLVRVLAGLDAPDAGKAIFAENVQIVLFDQHREELDLSQTLRRALFPDGDTASFRGEPVHVVGWAERFLFRKEQLDLPVGELSGGERARVLVARLMLRPADVLILDEPTNDLDIPTLDVLEASLLDFPGAVVLVTHDRHLLGRVATEILAIDGRGGASPYASLEQWERAGEPEKVIIAKPQAAKTSKSKLTWNEKKELEGMEGAILEVESSIESLQAEVADPAVAADHVRMAEACRRLVEAQAEGERLYERWADLEGKS